MVREVSTVREIIEQAKHAQGSLAGGDSSPGDDKSPGAIAPDQDGGSSPPASELEQAWPFMVLDKCGIATHLSASSLGMYYRCREQFRRRYILGHKEPPKEIFLWGDADDKTFSYNFEKKIDSGEDRPAGELKNFFVNAVDEYVNDAGGEGEFEKWADPEKKSGHVKDNGILVVEEYRKKAAPLVQPVAVQKRFDVFVDGVPVPIIGYMDVVEGENIIERKTAGNKWSKPSGNYLMQGRIYQLAERKPTHWHVSTKKTKSVYTPADEAGLLDPFREENVKKTESWIRNTVQAILSDFLEFGPDNPWPGARWQMRAPCFNVCGFRDSCEWWR